MAKDLFILRTVFEDGSQLNEILGDKYMKVRTLPTCKSFDSRICQDLREYPLWWPTSPDFILTSEAAYNLGTMCLDKTTNVPICGKVKAYYIICNGNTMDTIRPIDWAESEKKLVNSWIEQARSNTDDLPF